MSWLRPDFDTDVGPDPGGSLKIAECNFELKVEDKVTGWFYSMSGGQIEVSVIKHDIVFESGSSTTLFIPGPTSFSPFTLSKGFANYWEVYNWLMQASNGDIIRARRAGTITLYSTNLWAPQVRWHFYNAWPTKLESFSSFMSTGTTTAIAKIALTLVAESIEYERIT